jgi:hypothetical protein
MARSNPVKKLHLGVDADIVDDLDSIVDQDVRFWNRTHLINEALRMYVIQWEEDREDEPVNDMTEEVMEAEGIDEDDE